MTVTCLHERHIGTFTIDGRFTVLGSSRSFSYNMLGVVIRESTYYRVASFLSVELAFSRCSGIIFGDQICSCILIDLILHVCVCLLCLARSCSSRDQTPICQSQATFDTLLLSFVYNCYK